MFSLLGTKKKHFRIKKRVSNAACIIREEGYYKNRWSEEKIVTTHIPPHNQSQSPETSQTTKFTANTFNR